MSERNKRAYLAAFAEAARDIEQTRQAYSQAEAKRITRRRMGRRFGAYAEALKTAF